MSVAVSCNLSDGVVLGVDSAVAISASGSVAKTYENAEKLFQLGDRPIGVAVFGIGTLGDRSIGSYIREFEIRDPKNVVSTDTSVRDVVEELRQFLLGQYEQTVVPALEQSLKKPFAEIPQQNTPLLGIVVGGFSAGEYLSEVWQVILPRDNVPQSADQRRGKGQFGANWFALFEPIRRYFKGYDPALLDSVIKFCETKLKAPLSADEKKELHQLVQGFEYQVPFAAMPMEEGVRHVRFLVELVINHHRFALGAPVVGGQVRIGKVTYRGEKFEIIEGQQ